MYVAFEVKTTERVLYETAEWLFPCLRINLWIADRTFANESEVGSKIQNSGMELQSIGSSYMGEDLWFFDPEKVQVMVRQHVYAFASLLHANEYIESVIAIGHSDNSV